MHRQKTAPFGNSPTVMYEESQHSQLTPYQNSIQERQAQDAKIVQRLFYENISLCFENIYEAGYSYKYKNEIWQPQEDESSIMDTPSSKNTSYKERGKSFQLTKRARSGEASSSMTPRNNADLSKKKMISKNRNRCC